MDMRKELLLDALGCLEGELVREHLENKRKFAKRAKTVWIKYVALAACVALLLGAVLAVPWIPTRYNLDYASHEYKDYNAVVKYDDHRYWIYYVNEKGSIRRERVELDVPSMENRLLVWRHLNGVGDGVEIELIYHGGDVARVGDRTLEIAVTRNLTRFPHYEALAESLVKTFEGNYDAVSLTLVSRQGG